MNLPRITSFGTVSAGPEAGAPQGAFTLIEILLAVGVFSIVLIAINTVYFSALRLRNRATEMFENSVPLQRALTVIKRDLEGLMLPGGTLAGKLQTDLTSTANSTAESVGERVSPDLYTTTGGVDDTSPYSEVQKVAYYLTTSTNLGPGRDLVRSVTRNLLPAATELPDAQVLLSGVDEAVVLFYDGTDWTETWDSTTQTNLPSAIKVQIALASKNEQQLAVAEPIELVVPVLVKK
jgi:type II secretion system protein J